MQRKRVVRRKTRVPYGRAEFVDPGQVAARVGVHRNTLLAWVREGRFPEPCLRSGRRVLRWRRQVVESWVDDRTPGDDAPESPDIEACGDKYPGFVVTVSF